MYSSGILPLSFLILLIGPSWADDLTCDAKKKCPGTAACCSEFGYCGPFCFGGCNPASSFSTDSCKPDPPCKDAEYKFTDMNRIFRTSDGPYTGDFENYDWTLDSGEIIDSPDGGALMILNQKNGGTRLSSTRYVHYGTVTARLKATRWGGMATAFIFMSDNKEEVDWEFPGTNVNEGQTNIFWLGGHLHNGDIGSEKHKVPTDRSKNWHDYTIDWQPDQLVLKIDGKEVRTIKAEDTKDETGAQQFPKTPTRVELSIWPALDNTPSGTRDWLGGSINWEDPDFLANGYFSAAVESVTVKCGAQSEGGDTMSPGPANVERSTTIAELL